MGDEYNLILSAEESFARRVALGMIMKRPVKPWLQLIPGMFIFDFLKRTSEIRRYSQYFMFPRKLAINAARDMAHGEDKDERLSRIENMVRAWLGSLNLFSHRTHKAQIAIIHFHIDHYTRLIRADGDNYSDLVKNAYRTRENYEDHLNQLLVMEQEIDQAITEKIGEESLRQRLLSEQQEREEQRKKDLKTIF